MGIEFGHGGITIEDLYEEVTLAELLALISGGNINPNILYIVSYIASAQFGYDIKGYFRGDAVNQVAVNGEGLFYNADYESLGTYTSPGLTGVQLGIWNALLAPASGDCCIWNNIHYENLTGANGAGDPSIDGINWGPLTRETSNGYIQHLDAIQYKINGDQITQRHDAEYNNIYQTTSSMDLFKWGSGTCNNNVIFNTSACKNCNNNGVFNNNIIKGNGTTFLYGTQNINSVTINNCSLDFTNSYDTSNNFITCYFQDSTIINLNGCTWLNNIIESCDFNTLTNFFLEECQINDCAAELATDINFVQSILQWTTFDNLDTVNISSTLIIYSQLDFATQLNFFYCYIYRTDFSNTTGTPNNINYTIFENYNIPGFTFGAGAIQNCTFKSSGITIKNDITFNGAAGSGQVGPIFTTPAPVASNFQPIKVNYVINVALVGAGSAINAGSTTGTELLNDITGDIATLNLNPKYFVLANDMSETGLASFQMAVTLADITAGVIKLTAFYEPI